MNPKAIGEVSEAAVLARLVLLGYPVLLPFGNNQRYDLVFEDKADGRLVRAQVKTGRYDGAVVRFPVASRNGFTGVRNSYHGAIDVFLVYVHALSEVYMVPVELTRRSECYLRVEPTKGGPTSTLRWAKDFVLT